MMLPEAAQLYAEAISKKRTKLPTGALKETTIGLTESNKKAPKPDERNSKLFSTNWEKFKTIVSQPSQGTKSTSKRQLSNYGTPQKGKRKVKELNVSSSNNSTIFPKKINIVMASMDLENMELTKHVAMDCEMVGIGDGTESMIARVSMVNRHGACIYDNYVKPREIVQDYRTAVSGIRPHHLRDGVDFEVVQSEVAEILKGRVLVGHALKNDLTVLFLSHPKRYIRDTSRYKDFRKISKGNTPSLKKLATELLGIDIQTGEHNSIEDARTAMQLYVLYKNRWESDLHAR